MELDAFVIMPNHVHGIVIIHDTGTRDDDVGGHGRAPRAMHGRRAVRQPRPLGSFVAGYKAAVTSRINQLRNTPRTPVWQRNYYERVIRNDEELARIRKYVEDNPAKWADDPENVAPTL